jgi:ADP-glucose pyrophosphorylase
MSYVAGANTLIDQTATVSDSVFWDDVKLGASTQIHRAVLADGVTIPDGEIIENAVVVPRQLVAGKTRPEKALPGHFRGENFVVPL